MVRIAPPPELADAAAMLACSAYLRGDGSLASVALERAERECNGHRLTTLLRLALNSAVPPEVIRNLLAADADARA